MNVAKKARVDAYFDSLVDRFNENEHREDVQNEVEENLSEFLEFGEDLQQIIRMMSPYDVFYRYDTLVSAGGKIDLNKLAAALGNDFIYDHLGEMGKLGSNVDNLFKTMCRNRFVGENMGMDVDSFQRSVKDLLGIGVKILSIFEVSEPVLDSLAYDDPLFQRTLPVLRIFVNNGLDDSVVTTWLTEYITCSRLREMFNETEFADELREFGIKIEDFVDDYIDEISDYDPEDVLSLFIYHSDTVPADRVMERVSYKTLIEGSYDICDLIERFRYAGGHIEVLAKKFVKEVGYTGEKWDVRDLLEIVSYDDACKEVDFTKFAESINPAMFKLNDELDMDDLKLLLKRCSENGVSPELIKKFKRA